MLLFHATCAPSGNVIEVFREQFWQAFSHPLVDGNPALLDSMDRDIKPLCKLFVCASCQCRFQLALLARSKVDSGWRAMKKHRCKPTAWISYGHFARDPHNKGTVGHFSFRGFGQILIIAG